MGSNRSVLGLTLPLLVLTVVPSALVSAGATRADYNSDGWPDLLVCGETGGLHLFDNDQGQGFTDVSSFLGAQVNAVDAAMVDVNHDSRPDLITLTGTKVAERLLIGNATGGFTTMTIPQTTVGGGNRAYPIDDTHDGLSSFLVLNGQVPNPGPIQLLTPQPHVDGSTDTNGLVSQWHYAVSAAPRRGHPATATRNMIEGDRHYDQGAG